LVEGNLLERYSGRWHIAFLTGAFFMMLTIVSLDAMSNGVFSALLIEGRARATAFIS